MSNSNFSRCLSLLRQEKGVSQRVAAKELLVSQALLSHYENGIREPGLNFVLRACEYYKVSADFLLGRTLSRDGTVIVDIDRLRDISGGVGKAVDANSVSLLAKNLLGNSLELLLDLLNKTGNEEIVRTAANSLSNAIYTIFRHFYQADGTGNREFFSVSSQKFALSAATIDALCCEMEYVEALLAHAKGKGAYPDLSNEALEQETALYQSLLHIIYITGERINRRTGGEPGAKHDAKERRTAAEAER